MKIAKLMLHSQSWADHTGPNLGEDTWQLSMLYRFVLDKLLQLELLRHSPVKAVHFLTPVKFMGGIDQMSEQIFWVQSSSKHGGGATQKPRH